MGRFKLFNPNPDGSRIEDCAVRAICGATGQGWEETYIQLCLYGLMLHDMPHANHVWGRYLRDLGWKRRAVPDCPDCVTVSDFVESHPHGTYILSLPSHVVAAVDGSYLDTWDSGDCVVVYCFTKEE